MTSIIQYLVIFIFTAVLAAKDGFSYLLIDRRTGNEDIIKKWHITGAILYVIFLLFLAFSFKDFYVVILAGIIRLAFYDVVFNKVAKLNKRYIGFTSPIDRIFRKMFGEDGALRKATMFFFASLIYLTLKQIL